MTRINVFSVLCGNIHVKVVERKIGGSQKNNNGWLSCQRSREKIRWHFPGREVREINRKGINRDDGAGDYDLAVYN